MHQAAYWGHTEAVKFLIHAGADPNAVDKDLRTPLFWAVVQGDAAAIDTMFAAGMYFNPVTRLGSHGMAPNRVTLLHVAAENGHVAAIEALLAAGMPVDAVYGEGLPHAYREVTPLHVAAENGHVAAIEALLAAGARVYHPRFDDTPLDRAVSAGHTKAAEILRRAGNY